MTHRRPSRWWVLALSLAPCLVGAVAAPLRAKTIHVTDLDCERMAVISPDAPEMSWAANESPPGLHTTKYTLYLKTGKAFLIVFPLDGIPKGQRITQAELTVPIPSVVGTQRLTVRRVLGDWGPGVNHKYRRQTPKKVEWDKPGATSATDLAAKASTVLKVDSIGEKTINVTEDIELWYSGAAKNNGWAFRVEEDSSYLHLASPLSTYPNGYGAWKLRITYEPE
jgi:hypothetical protein